jgi:hypothetical protein
MSLNSLIWKNVNTYPHHKHENNQVLPSHRVTIRDVLDEIKKKIRIIHGKTAGGPNELHENSIIF